MSRRAYLKVMVKDWCDWCGDGPARRETLHYHGRKLRCETCRWLEDYLR